MGFFGFSKPKVSKKEFKDSASFLRAKGFSNSDIDNIKKIFHGSLHEGGFDHSGIDKKELAEGIKWLKANKSKHTLSDSQINFLEEVLIKKL